MNKSFITPVIILMTLSLVGIVLVQLFWIKNAIEIKEEQFDQSVNEALSEVVERLKVDEDVFYVANQIWTDEDGHELKYVAYSDSAQNEFILEGSESNSYIYVSDNESGTIQVNGHGSAKISVESFEDEGVRLETIIKLDSLKDEVHAEQYYFISQFKDSVDVIVKKRIKEISSGTEDLKDVIDQMVVEIKNIEEPFADRIDPDQINQRLSESLNDKGIDLPFEFAVYNPDKDTVLSIHSENFDINNDPYQTRLSPDNVISRPELLMLSFTGKRGHIFKSLATLLSGSLLFTFIIILTFFLTLRIIFRQKKLADIKSDFINNMTHEFKTPIATISLAVDSINNPKVIDNPEKVRYFTDIIEDENSRMNTRVENVLQMSLIDKSDFDFYMEEIDVHEIIRKAAKNIELQVKKKEGKIELKLEAQDSILKSDQAHLLNVITNLLDNAIKYSEEKPEIIIATINKNNDFIISVSDNGIGMSKEEIRKIFDRFFRVSKGDIHNVKGFGLGLSYVKAIVLAMGGKIDVKSEPVKGTTMFLRFPIRKDL